MPDVHDAATRSRNMAAIRDRNTKPELIIRKGLHARGFRYRLHDRCLPGKPDLVFPKFRAVIFVNGCFWHGHDCPMFRLPATRTEFWRGKISGTVKRDLQTRKQLENADWRIGTIWECAIRGPERPDLTEILSSAAGWIRSSQPKLILTGRASGIGHSPAVCP